MDKVLAGLFIVSAQFFVMLGNFWFTYGLWPLSWVAFGVFLVIGIIVNQLLRRYVDGTKK
jgi:hypothetical protein